MTPCYQRHELGPGIHTDIPHEHEGGAVNKSMAEVLSEHEVVDIDVLDGVRHCACGLAFQNEGHVNHQDDALTAAGFGPVKAAEAPEVRYVDTTTEKDVLDEVVARDAYVHLEAMDNNHWWLLVTSGGKSVHVNFYTKRAKISGHAEVEDADVPSAATIEADQ